MLMRQLTMTALLGVMLAAAASAQTDVPPANRVIRFSGAVADTSQAVQGGPLTFAVYDRETGGTLMWQETQAPTFDGAGNYSVFLGGTSREGLPLSLFSSGAPRWLSVEIAGKATGPRTLLAAVPYAVSAATAANAQGLAGRPASDYLLTPAARQRDAADSGSVGATIVDPQVNNGSAGFIGKFFNSVDLDNSVMFQSGNNIGVGTTAPLDALQVNFTNNAGSATGYAVRNLGNTANSYSGMLFYDHTGALRQFQGYNNSTGEYRINNISPSGSINFMTGTSKFKVAASTGYIGLNAEGLTPLTRIHLFGAVSGTDDYTIRGSRASGTLASPTAVSTASSLVRLEGAGYNGSAYTVDRALIRLFTTEAWSTTANGTAISFSTTTNGTTAPAVRMQIDDTGNVGIGTTSPAVQLEVAGDVRATGGNFQPLSTAAYGVRWVDAGGIIQAHMFRYSVNNRLYVTNNGAGNLTGVYLDDGATNWTSTSDERLKRNITPMTGLLAKIKSIRVAAYDMATLSAGANGTIVDRSVTRHEIGSIAQDWLKDFPELVAKPKTEGEYYGLSYDRIGVVAIGAVQELNAVVEAKDAEVKSLTERIAALEAALKALTATTVQQQR